MNGADSKTVPAPVKLAAAAFVVLAVRQVVMKSMPAFEAGDPSVLSEFLDVAMLLFITWGLLARQRWAWWLGVIMSGAGWMIPTALLGAMEVPELRDAFAQEIPDVRLAVQQLAIIGAASFVAFAALVSRTGREAFRA